MVHIALHHGATLQSVIQYQHKGRNMTKITEQKNGAYTTFERLFPSGMYLVMLYSTRGEVMDKIRCDTYHAAREYLAAFNRIAKAQ